MEWLIKLLPIVLSFLLPLLKDLIINRRHREKETREDLIKNCEDAENFELLDDSYSQLFKDRYAKKVFNNKDLNYDELEFFIKYKDADYWVNKYIKVRWQLESIKNSELKIIGFKPMFTLKSSVVWGIFYVVSMICFATPFIFFKKYNVLIQQSMIDQNYLMTVELSLFPLIFLAIGIVSLLEYGKIKEGRNFVKKLKKHIG